MKQLPSYGDARTLAFCAFCGGETGTRDHCPSRVFLDEPFPENLPVVPACLNCNGGFSEDEEYLACLLSCVIAGSTSPDAMPREKAKRILQQKPALQARIEAARVTTDEGPVFVPEHHRVCNVITKLAQGHALYELHESCTEPPSEVAYVPLPLMSDAQREAFEKPEQAAIWPEVGSRAMQRMLSGIQCRCGDPLSHALIDQIQRYGLRLPLKVWVKNLLAVLSCLSAGKPQDNSQEKLCR